MLSAGMAAAISRASGASLQQYARQAACVSCEVGGVCRWRVHAITILCATATTDMHACLMPPGQDCVCHGIHAAQQERAAIKEPCRAAAGVNVADLKAVQNSNRIGPAVAWTSLRLSFCRAPGHTTAASGHRKDTHTALALLDEGRRGWCSAWAPPCGAFGPGCVPAPARPCWSARQTP